MKTRAQERRVLGLAGCFAVFLVTGGCSVSKDHPDPVSSRAPASKPLDASQAAELAATLANRECERLHKRSPFKPEQFAVVRQGDLYRWGGLDEGAPGGFSALVTFATDGSNPEVEVYYSSDQVIPRFEKKPPFSKPDLP